MQCMLRTAKPCAPRTRKVQLHGYILWAAVSLAQLLAFTKSLASRLSVVHKPNTLLKSDANDFVSAKGHACNSVSAGGWCQKILSAICNVCRWGLFTGIGSFLFITYLIVQNNNCKSGARTLWGKNFSSLSGENKKQEFGNDRSTPQKSKNSPAQSPRTWSRRENSAKEVLRLESLSIWSGMFPGFPTENFAYMESAPGNHRFPTPSVQGTNGDLSPGP